jgi:5-oxoprolinase (ATP-hydrolysing)
VEAVEVEAVGGGARIDEPELPRSGEEAGASGTTRFFSDGAWRDASVYCAACCVPDRR